MHDSWQTCGYIQKQAHLGCKRNSLLSYYSILHMQLIMNITVNGSDYEGSLICPSCAQLCFVRMHIHIHQPCTSPSVQARCYVQSLTAQEMVT